METTLEHILTNSYKAQMISYLASHPEDFEEAIMLAIADKQPYSWRAAWLLWSCMERNDERVKKYVKNIIDSLSDKSDNQQRDLLIVLQQIDIDEEYEGVLFDHCVNVWEQINKKPSVRFNAFKMIVKIAKNHTDLYHEIMFLTEEKYMDSLSSAVRKSIAKMMKELS